MYNAVKRGCTLFFILFLIFLFTVPAAYLRRLTGELDGACETALAALEQRGDPTPQLELIRSRFDESAPILRMFLDHDAVDQALSAVHALNPRAEPADIQSGLEVLRAELKHLAGIEKLELASLF